MNKFETTDISLATTLVCLDLQCKVVVNEDQKKLKGTFIFENTNVDFDSLLDDYYKGRLKVEPKKFTFEMRSLKSRVYESMT
jgi:hypothetical protein